MAKNKTEVGGAGPFFCEVAQGGQIFIPAGMMKAMGIAVGEVVEFSLGKDGKVATFSRGEDASKENLGQEKKDKVDAEKRTESMR